MREHRIELTPQAVTEIRHWLLLLAGDPAAPQWSPVEDYRTPDALRAAARWLVDNGHGLGMDHDLVGVLLALFSIDLRWEMEAGIDGLAVPQDASAPTRKTA
jgi:hypothetical protein